MGVSVGRGRRSGSAFQGPSLSQGTAVKSAGSRLRQTQHMSGQNQQMHELIYDYNPLIVLFFFYINQNPFVVIGGQRVMFGFHFTVAASKYIVHNKPNS